MKNRRSYAIGIMGLILIVLTIVLFFITPRDEIKTSGILGLCFMVYSELVAFGGLIAIEYISEKNSQILLRSGCGSALVFYSVITFVISFVYMHLKTDVIWHFWFIQLILLALAAVVFIIFYTTSKSVKKSDDRILGTVARVADMVNSLTLLKVQGKYSKQLEKIIDHLKYIDISSGTAVDDELEKKITKLELKFMKEESNEIEAMIEEIAILIKKRKVQVRNTKIGGI